MTDWKDILISPSASIRDAMRAIDSGSLKTAFVVSDEQCILGSVTDGDIRRGLLGLLNMDDPVTTVMNQNPVTCGTESSKQEVQKILRQYDILCVPVVEENKIKRIETLLSASKYEKRKNPVFIMAGGFGTRLKPLTDSCPKPMLPVGQKPMLEILIERLSNQGFSNFYLSTHYLSHVIENHFGNGSKWNIKIDYIYEDVPLGTGGALSLIKRNISDLPILMLNGDILTDLDFTKLLDYHSKNDFDITMCLRELEHQISYGVVDTDGSTVIGIREKPKFIHDINTGIYVLSPSAVLGVDEGRYIDMPSYIEQRINNDKIVGAFRHPGYWLDIGRMTDYQKAQRDVSEIFHIS